MPTIMNLPKLGVNMEKATIVEWVVKEGETVKEGQHLFDAETDKAVQEIPATVSGVLTRILAQPNETINCGEPVAIFTEVGEKLPADFSLPLEGEKEAVAAVQPELRPSPGFRPPDHQGKKRVRVSPLAQKVAKKLGVDIRQVAPSKPGARITKTDVLAFVGRGDTEKVRFMPSVPPLPPPDTTMAVRGVIPLKNVRKVIADRMATSAHTTARAALFLRADVTELQKWRERLNKDGNQISFNDLFVFIVARILGEFPELNSRMVGEEIQLMEDINIGVAVDTERGLVVPTIRNADQKGVLEINEDFRVKLDRARAGKSNLEDLSAGTFTITNLGMFGIEGFVPIINPPECAILSMGSIQRQPVVIDEKDTIQVCPMVQLCLVWDHRIVDGAPAARFLRRIKQLVEWPMGFLS
jgi:pyruvate dehydrogenase E2 component (dihydrolipoamide acetyltransferase)